MLSPTSPAREQLQRAHERILATPGLAESVNATLRFVVTGAGGGTFLMNLADQPGVVEGDGDAGCTLTLTEEDLVAMFKRQVEGFELFSTGRLQLDGDPSLALRLAPLLELLGPA